MDVSRPISAIVPTLDGPVLAALTRTSLPLTGRQVHALAGGSEAGVRKVLARLVHQGVVHVTPAGPSLLYVANRDHLAWPAVEILAALSSQLQENIQTRLRDWSPAPVHASMFGSAARRDGSADSDIDLFVLRPDDCDEDSEPWATQVDRLRADVFTQTGNRCHVFQLDSRRLADHAAIADPLISEWRADAVTLVGDAPDVILGRLRD
jgi:hypothetical protein